MLILNDKVYNATKFVAQIVLPALATLYFALALLWSFPDPQKVVGTITAVDTFLGVVLGISAGNYNKSDAKFDGALRLEQTEDETTNLRLHSLDEQAVLTQDSITLKVLR